MPLQFQFTKNSAVVSLDDIEAEYLARTGLPTDVYPAFGPRSAHFEVLCLIGIACTRGIFNQAPVIEQYADTPTLIPIMLDFLDGTYKFESWR